MRELVFQSASTSCFENPIPNCLESSPKGLNSFIDILPEFLDTVFRDQRQVDNPLYAKRQKTLKMRGSGTQSLLLGVDSPFVNHFKRFIENFEKKKDNAGCLAPSWRSPRDRLVVVGSGMELLPPAPLFPLCRFEQ